jgi:hypothetical protein
MGGGGSPRPPSRSSPREFAPAASGGAKAREVEPQREERLAEAGNDESLSSTVMSPQKFSGGNCNSNERRAEALEAESTEDEDGENGECGEDDAEPSPLISERVTGPETARHAPLQLMGRHVAWRYTQFRKVPHGGPHRSSAVH